MENRSHALLAGLFTLALLVAIALTAVWLGRDRSPQAFYEIVSTNAISGLNTQSNVRYQGVPVGKVQALTFNPQHPGEVRIRIGIAATTPLTTSTWAELGLVGVTGMATVELRDNGQSSERLVSQPGQLATIPLHPGLLARSSNILANVESATQQLRQILSEQNVRALSSLLHNTSEMAKSLNSTSQALTPVITKLGPLVDTVRNTAQELGGLSTQTRQIMATLNAPNGPLNTMSRSLNQVAAAATRLNFETLPAITTMAYSIGNTAQGVHQTLRQVGSTPQSLLFGPPPAVPGPGEAGFTGFERSPQ